MIVAIYVVLVLIWFSLFPVVGRLRDIVSALMEIRNELYNLNENLINKEK